MGLPELPLVSVVMPVLNEEQHIEASLRSVLDQDYPVERVEVFVADGGSTDMTLEIVRRVGAGRNVRVLANPGRQQAAGLNLAILASSGTVIARQDGHAEWGSRAHLRRSVELLLETEGIDNVGGSAVGVGSGPVGRAIAAAQRSPFGVGGARFRYSTHAEDVATVFPGTFRRSAFERVGLFNEAYPPHEDYELNHRIRQSGGRVLFSPDLPTRYHVRDSWQGLARQYFRYGRAKLRVAREHPGVLRPYHLVPPTMVASAVAVGGGAVAARRLRPLPPVFCMAYAVLCLAAAQHSAHPESVGTRLRTALAFPVMHACWGAGFWAGVWEIVMGNHPQGLKATEALPPLRGDPSIDTSKARPPLGLPRDVPGSGDSDPRLHTRVNTWVAASWPQSRPGQVDEESSNHPE